MLKIAITGSTGLIGSRIIELLKDDFEFIELIEGQIDITKIDSVWNALKQLDFDILFHLAAYTNVDGAEQSPGKELAYKINVEGTKYISDSVWQKRKKLIYVSTDFVFDGKNPPFYENSKANPLGYYAQTKFEGENLVNRQAMIVRFSYPYRAKHPFKPDFVKRLKNLLEQKKQTILVTDSLMTPTFIDDIAYTMKYLFNNFTPDVFHIVGENSMSPFDSGKIIAKTFRLDKHLISPTTFLEYSKGKALRPQFSDIRSKKNHFYKMRTFEEGLQEVLKQI
ncbi:sugar nucleotide-binding protein [Candidatus Roizmanbacteria bacterium]|nr:sugar nucleotide-binding protein [Candidatus Roizmanbacteria bacterium]